MAHVGQEVRHVFCGAESSDGFTCVLFKDHKSEQHMSKHLAQKWTDADQKAVKHTEFSFSADYAQEITIQCEDWIVCHWSHDFTQWPSLAEVIAFTTTHTAEMNRR